MQICKVAKYDEVKGKILKTFSCEEALAKLNVLLNT